MRTLLLIIFLLFAIAEAQASGSIEITDIDEVIEKSPWAMAALAAFNIKNQGIAETRIGSFHKYLGGKRIGPYLFEAKTKGTNNEVNLVIVICTKATYLSESGETVDFMEAVTVQETINSILIREKSDVLKIPYCSDN